MFLQAEEPGTWPEYLKRKMEIGETSRDGEEMEI
jgi:hypothetical protein